MGIQQALIMKKRKERVSTSAIQTARSLLRLDFILADSHTHGDSKRPRIDPAPGSSASSGWAKEAEAQPDGKDTFNSSFWKGSPPTSREDTMSSSTTKEGLRDSIWRLLPRNQPGICPNVIQAQLLIQNPELSANWSSPNGFRSAISVALKRLVDGGEADREEAIGPKGGRTYEYVALEQEKSSQTPPGGQTVTKDMESEAGAAHPAHDYSIQVQRPTTVGRLQLQSSKRVLEDGMEVPRCITTLHSAKTADKQVPSPCAGERSQRGVDTCKQGRDSPRNAPLMHLVKAEKAANLVSGPLEASQVEKTPPKGPQDLVSKPSGKMGRPAQATRSTGIQSAISRNLEVLYTVDQPHSQLSP